MKLQLVFFHGDFNFVARFDFPIKQFHRQRVEQELLDGAFEWAGAELRIITLLRQIMCGGSVEF